MTGRMMELFEKVHEVVLATIDQTGIPNAVPIGTKKIIDPQTVLMSNQFLNKTLANIKEHPQVAVTFWEGAEGYQLKGQVNIETTGDRFEQTAKWIEELSAKLGFPMKSKGAVILHIEEIYGVSPGPGAGKKLS